MKIGWCCTAHEAAIVFEEPKRVVIEKDASTGGRGFLSCPSVRTYFGATFAVRSPFSLRLSFEEGPSGPVIRPVFPFTSLTQAKVQELVKVEPRSSWRDSQAVVIQIPSPYLFFADEPAVLRQDPVQLSTPTSHSWRLIPGKFNIYDWQRPMNWAVEWYPQAGDFIIKAGEPLYYVSFENPEGPPPSSVDLIECDLTPELENRLKETRGVTSMRRGIKPLFAVAKAKRKNMNFLSAEV